MFQMLDYQEAQVDTICIQTKKNRELLHISISGTHQMDCFQRIGMREKLET